MSRTIDHLVLASRNLTQQAAFFESLGFRVGPENRHPWGTINRIIQLEDSFLELISTGQGFRAPTDLPSDQFSFSGFIHAYLQRREGAAMVALVTQNAAADRRLFHAENIGDFQTFHFARTGRRPDGSQVEVAFTLAFAHSSLMPEIGFFACQHHHPENFWNDAWRQHDNGARRLASATIVAANPAAHGEFLSHVTGARDFRSSSLGLSFALSQEPAQALEVLTPIAFEQLYGLPAPDSVAHTPSLSACCIGGCDLSALAARLEQQGIEYRQNGRFIVIDPAIAFGAALIFV